MDDMKRLVRCKSGHVFRLEDAKTFQTAAQDGTPVFACQCPHCESPDLEEVPAAVIDAVRAKFDKMKLGEFMLGKLHYDTMNGCYFFTYANMYHGVETDGYIHT